MELVVVVETKMKKEMKNEDLHRWESLDPTS